MLSRWLAFVVWALLGATVVTWLLQSLSSPLPVPPHAIAVDTSASFRTELTRLFGAPAVTAPAAEAAPKPSDDRLKLIGLVASTSSSGAGSSLALIAMDGKPARAYRVGAVVDGDRQVLAVRKGAVDIGPSGGPVAFTLSLPDLPPPATGTPQSAAGAVAPVAPGAPMPSQMPVPQPAPQPGMEFQPPQQPPPPQAAPIEPQPIMPPQSPPAQPG